MAACLEDAKNESREAGRALNVEDGCHFDFLFSRRALVLFDRGAGGKGGRHRKGAGRGLEGSLRQEARLEGHRLA